MKDRIIGLDIIRSLAIISVFWYHGGLLVPGELKFIANLPLATPFEGVSTFFVLSGFLIGRIFLKNFTSNSYNFSHLYNFWKRRWWRTLPAYFLILLVLIFLKFEDWNYNWSFFYFSHKLELGSNPNFFAVAWSLAVEEWFYFLFPLLTFIVYLITKKKKLSFLMVTLIFILSPFIARLILQSNGFDSWEFRHITFLRLDGIMYGVLASYIFTHLDEVWKKLKKPFLFLGIIWSVLFTVTDLIFKSEVIELFRYNIEAISVLFFLPFLNDLTKLKNSTIEKVIHFISKTSYSFYLVHANIVLWIIVRKIQQSQMLCNIRFELQRIILFLVYFILSAILSWVMYRFFEKPTLKLRDKFTFSEK